MKSIQTKALFIICATMIVLESIAPRVVTGYDPRKVMEESNNQVQERPRISIQTMQENLDKRADKLTKNRKQQVKKNQKIIEELNDDRDGQLDSNKKREGGRRDGRKPKIIDEQDTAPSLFVPFQQPGLIGQSENPTPPKPGSNPNPPQSPSNQKKPENGKNGINQSPNEPTPDTTPSEPQKPSVAPSESIPEGELTPDDPDYWERVSKNNGKTLLNPEDHDFLLQQGFPMPSDLYYKEYDPEKYRKIKDDSDKFYANFQRKHGPNSAEYREWYSSGEKELLTGIPVFDTSVRELGKWFPTVKRKVLDPAQKAAGTVINLRDAWEHSQYLSDLYKIEYLNYRLEKMADGDWDFSPTLRDRHTFMKESGILE